jgi:hypothetical protein
MAFRLNHDNMLFLDAEDLAEAGIKKAYDSLARDLGPVYLAARGSGGSNGVPAVYA